MATVLASKYVYVMCVSPIQITNKMGLYIYIYKRMGVYITHKNKKENTVSFLLMFPTFAARQTGGGRGGIFIYIFWG
jgi:hypothetical protein